MRLPYYYIGCLILLACNNQTTSMENKVTEKAKDPIPVFTEDSIPSYEVLNTQDSLDETIQFKLFKTILKPVKTKKMYDFSTVTCDKMPDIYNNFSKTLTSYEDSSSVYIAFFNTLYNRLDANEVNIPGMDTMDVRTRLGIARIKSQIKDRLASSTLKNIQ